MNSFKYGCVVNGKWYCGRPFLERELSKFVASGQNVVLLGERRMGKTSLLHETLRGMKGWRLIYVDLLHIHSVEDFCKRVLSAVRDFHGKTTFFEKALRLLPRLRPVVNYDPVCGSFGYTFDVKASQTPEAVEEVIGMLAAQARKKKVAIAFDEFQSILDLPDCQQALALLRGKIQFQPEIPYVFTGSVRHQMTDLFDNPDSAFYKSAITLCVGPIDRTDFVRFLKGRFSAAKRRLEPGVLAEVLSEVDDIPGDAQELCEALCDVTEENTAICSADIARALEVVFAREGDKFEGYCSQLSPIQFKLIVAMAAIGGKNLQSADFLRVSGISNAASVRRALSRLAELRYIYKYRDEWKFNSTFFRSWLKRYA